MEIIPIFYTIDNDYAKFVAVSISSLIAHADRENYHYHIHVVYENLDEENARILDGLATDGVEIFLDPMKKSLEMITDRMGNYLRASIYTLTIYFRIFIPEMFPEYDRCIYLDSDTVICDDIAKLWREEIGDNYLGGIPDFSILNNAVLIKYLEKAVGVPAKSYINSGVLLMNARALRERELERRFLELYNKYEMDVIAPDQDYINVLCHGRIKYLDEKYDVMPNPARAEVAEPVVVHFNLFYKPWLYAGVQYEDAFWAAARQTPYYDQLRSLRDNYTEAERERDENAMSLMLERADKVADGEQTFRKVFAAGEKRL